MQRCSPLLTGPPARSQKIDWRFSVSIGQRLVNYSTPVFFFGFVCAARSVGPLTDFTCWCAFFFSSPGQSIAMCTVDPSVRNQKVETLRQVNETAKHQSTQAQSVLSNLKVYTGVMGPLIYPPSQQSLQVRPKSPGLPAIVIRATPEFPLCCGIGF